MGARREKELEGRWRGILSLLQQPLKQVLGSVICISAIFIFKAGVFVECKEDESQGKGREGKGKEGKMNELYYIILYYYRGYASLASFWKLNMSLPGVVLILQVTSYAYVLCLIDLISKYINNLLLAHFFVKCDILKSYNGRIFVFFCLI